jgi:hypothetical protein
VAVYYAGLLAWVGCHTDAYEQAKWFGDDLVVKANYRRTDGSGPVDLLRQLGAGRPLLGRARLALELLGTGMRDLAEMLENHWLASDDLARRLGLGPDVRQSLK